MLFPPAGIVGEVALREAAAGSFQDIIRRVEGAVRALFTQAGTADVYVYLRGLWPAEAVVSVSGKGADDRLLSYPYELVKDGTVTLGTPVPVVETFTPIDASMREAAGALLEAAAGEDAAVTGKFKVRVIRAGLSGNGNFYPDAVLREAVGLFEGVRVFVKSDAEHLKGGGKDLRNLVGRISGAAFVEGQGADSGEVQAVLSLIDPADAIGVKLREAVARDMADLFGLSIDAEGKARTGKAGGKPLRMATAITKIRSVDLIVEPGAGGAVISLIEAKDEDMALRARMIEAIQTKRPALLAGKDVATLSDDALEAIFAEALDTPAPTSPPPSPAPTPNAEEVARLVEARMSATIRRNSLMRERVERCGLPPQAKARIVGEFEAKVDFTEAAVDQRIRDEVAYLAPFARNGAVMELGDAPTFEPGQSRGEKFREALDAFWDETHKHHAQAQSIKALYVMATGDERVTGRLRNCDRALLREALDGDDFVNVFLDSMNKRVIQVYRAYVEMEIWRDLAIVVNVGDFREQSRVRWGGYGDLPIVAKNDPYLELDSPGEDDPAKYKVRKRGRLESIALEDIKNDDVGFVSWIPTGLGRAAKRTLAKFVLDFLRTNPTIYDGKALFHVDHGNLITAALASASYKDLRLKMKQQPDVGGEDVIGVNPKFLWVPDEQEETAFDLFTLGQRNDPDFTATLKPTIRPVWYWTDANDWAVSADPRDVPTIEIGFLDGQQEPELWTQDSPTAGSLFSNDQITYKIRHTYGGTVLDYRGLGKSVVPA
ncbi:phage major capsid protein [Azospirillum agricola]|uniref:phage major capsid protein n=1 Tax=Azospirillum agricola TaxID=1720247 RepID=UPI000A0F25F8|nr:hypothetical protein [Azospirillum agricola]SMH62846.1 hypothetical protein SAMN02982994_6669 [Azospirillum lipoferum]